MFLFCFAAIKVCRQLVIYHVNVDDTIKVEEHVSPQEKVVIVFD